MQASKYPIAQPRATEHKQQDVIAPSPHATTNLGGVNTPKDAGYAPLHESIASGATSVPGSVGSYASQGKVRLPTLRTFIRVIVSVG